MKRISAVFLCLACIGLARAEQVWQDPLTLYSARNIEFKGYGMKCSNGNYLLSFKDTAVPEPRQQFLLTDAAGNHLWQRSISLKGQVYRSTLYKMLETGGDYLLLVRDHSGFLYGYKYNSDGDALWPEDGIRLLSCNLIHNYSEGKWIKDAAGGFYGLWSWPLSGPDNPAQYYFQHMDYAGQTAIINGNTSHEFISLNDAALTALPDLFLLPDGGIICSYREGNNVVVRRMLPNHSFAWTNSLGAGAAVYPSLIDTRDGFFNLIWHTPTTIMAMRYDYSFTAQWAQQQVLCSNAEGMNAYSRKAVKCSDGSTLVAWQSGSQLWMQRLDIFGNQQCPAGGTLIMTDLAPGSTIELLPDAIAGCFVQVTSTAATGDTEIRGQYINSQNTLLPQAVVLAQSEPADQVGPLTSAALFPYGLSCFFQSEFPGSRCIERQAMDTAGSLVYPASPQSIVQGNTGSAYGPVVSSRTGNVLCAWLEDQSYPSGSSTARQIRYQLVQPDGTTLINPPGDIFAENSQQPVTDLKAIGTDQGSTLLCWIENTPPLRLKAQIIGPAGNELWEEGGRVISDTGLLTIGNNGYFLLTQAYGAAYIVWLQNNGTSSRDIRAQKISGLQTQWEIGGRTLLSTSYSSSLSLKALEQDYLIYATGSYPQGYQGSLMVYRFNADGHPMPGFTAFGWENEVAHLGSNYTGIAYSWCKAGTDRLFVGYAMVEPGPEWVTFHDFGKAISDTGTDLWGYYGIADMWGTAPFSRDNNLYLIEDHPIRHLCKYDSSGQLQWSHLVPTDPPGGYTTVYQMDSSWENRMVGLAGYHNLFYFCFDDLGWNALESDYSLATDTVISNPSMSRLNDELYVIWGSSPEQSLSQLSYIQLQRVNSYLVAADDPTAPPLELPTLHPAYPNPFSNQVAFSVTLPKRTFARIGIYNVRGQLVRKLSSAMLEKGNTALAWDGKDESGAYVSNGIYICRAKLGDQIRTIRMIKLR